MSLPARQTKPSSVAGYDAMCQAIEAAYNVDEVKDIRDQAIALEVYARQVAGEAVSPEWDTIRNMGVLAPVRARTRARG